MSDNSVPQNVVPFKPWPTNSEFLRAIFGDDADKAWVTAAAYDIGGNSTGWHGQRASDCDVNDRGFTVRDPYFSVGILKPGATARTAMEWANTRVVVIDDVAEKADAAALVKVLGEPSYKLRTSGAPGSTGKPSYQYGYLLNAPLDDADLQARIMRAITIAFYNGVDPGHGANVRYARLPNGFNSKPKRKAEHGGKAQPVALVEWHPERKFDVIDLMMALDDTPGMNGDTAWNEAAGAGVAHHSVPANLPQTVADALKTHLPGDYILAAFDKLGWIVGMQGQQGYMEVRCPFEDTHTNNDGRVGWAPHLFLSGKPGLKCFHSDNGADQSNRGVEAALKAELDARDGTGTFAALKRAAMAAKFPPLPDDDTADSDAGPPIAWIGKSRAVVPLPEKQRINRLLARGEVTGLPGQGGIGKSVLVLNHLLAIAADRPDLIGDTRPFNYTGDVLIVSNEDEQADVEKRRNGWLRRHGIDPDTMKHEVGIWTRPSFRAAALDHTGGVSLTPDMDKLAEIIAGRRASGIEVCVVAMDTLNTVLKGINENDNSAMGAAGSLLTSWAKKNNVALVILHHMPKTNGNAGGAGDAGAMRGASALKDAIRNVATLTALDGEAARRLPPCDRRYVFVLSGAKANHGEPHWAQHFKRELVLVDVVDADGNPGRELVPVMVPYTMPSVPAADSDAARLTVLAVLTEAAKAGDPMLVSGKGDKSAAKRIAAAMNLAGPKAAERITKTLVSLEEAGHIVKGDHKTEDRNKVRVWIVTDGGQNWRASQTDGPGGFSPVEPGNDDSAADSPDTDAEGIADAA